MWWSAVKVAEAALVEFGWEEDWQQVFGEGGGGGGVVMDSREVEVWAHGGPRGAKFLEIQRWTTAVLFLFNLLIQIVG